MTNQAIKCVATSLLFLSMTGLLSAKDFYVYYLGGQSNMDGYGAVSELPDDLRAGVPGVWIFHGNMGKDGEPADGRGLWSPLKPGHGRDFASDANTNQYSDRFGPELTFARRLKELHPDRNVAIIKYSRGGTSIDAAASPATQFGCWDPDWTGGEGKGEGVNQYDHFLATLANARDDSDIDDDGEEDRLIPAGIVWMQGESDAMDEVVAKRYEANLTRLVGLIRQAMGDKQLHVVIGRITDWQVWEHSDEVRAAQSSFVSQDDNSSLVTTTDNYGNSDPWHYDTAGYLDLGRQFADAVANDSK